MKIPYGKQWITEKEIEKIKEVLDSDFLTTGPFVDEFEQKFAEYVGSKYAIAVANGTAALHLSVQAIGLKQNYEVITTPMTFAATSNSVLYSSGRPVFADITDRGLIDPSEVRNLLSKETKGIMPVDYMGLPYDHESIKEIADETDSFVIEDGCHALGAKLKDNRIGSCKNSDMTVFSFHPVKHITTGEGGMITTNDEELYEKLKILRTHGITKNQDLFKSDNREPWFQEMHYLGFNYRLTDIQAALGISQLERIEEIVALRRQIAKRYFEFFRSEDLPVDVIEEKDDEQNSYHLFVIKLKEVNKRLELFNFLKSKGIYCQIHYIPVYWHPYYQNLGFKRGMNKNAEDFYSRIISLPMFPTLKETEHDYIEEQLKAFFMNV